MSKFLCSATSSGLVGTDTIFDRSELVGGNAQGQDTVVDTSEISVL
jgi:hypothetical protein